MKIKILGTGCKKCEKMEQEVKNALAELNMTAAVEKVDDMNKIMDYDVLITPGLVINDKVKVSGKVPKQEQIKKWIQEEQ